MNYAKVALLLVALAVPSQQRYAERECPCTLPNLWVDVAIAIDVSNGMGTAGISQVAGDILSVFIQSNISQSLGSTTRVGIVTYSQYSHTNYALTYFNSTQQMIDEVFNIVPSQTTSSVSDIKVGLQGALNLLQNGRANHQRDNVQQAIIVYASDFRTGGTDDPVTIANNIKSSGIKLITVAFDQGGETKVLNGLKQLASPGMGYSSNSQITPDLVGSVQGSLCQTNCFCPSAWTQYANSFSSPVKGYGVCLRMGDIASAWLPAKMACQRIAPNAYLATEFDQSKHGFIASFAKADNTASKPHQYFIGLSKTSGNQWAWEQPAGQNQILMHNSSYAPWLPGYSSLGQTAVLNAPNSTAEQTFGWTTVSYIAVSSRYVCQVNTCDTDNYCA